MKIIIPIFFALILLTGTSGVSYESVFAQTPIDPPRQEAASPSDNNGKNDRLITGQLQIIWSHPNPNISSDFNPVKKYFLAGEESYELIGFEGAAIAHGGTLKMNGKDITVRGVHDPQTGILIVKGIENAGKGSSGDDSQIYAASTTGSQKWLTLPCKFADNSSEPQNLAYFEALLDFTDTFWREASYDTINLNGSVERDWKTLPQPGSYYVAGYIKHGLIANDCAAVHNADVHFPDFDGINFILNEALDCCALGGSINLNIDGQYKNYDATWMPPWAFNHMDILAHEMGHGFGLPHSSGPYSSTYDSKWDIMSGGGTCASTNYGFGCIGVHTVSWHKDVLGWIDASDVYVDDGTQNQVVFIERLAEPINVSDPNVYQVVKIPTSSSTDFYTLEVRKFAGFDAIGKIPGEAVVIHKVDTTLSDRNAQVVVNPYENAGTNGPGSKWTTGETYQFPDTNTSVLIGAMGNDGFNITLNPNGANPPPTADAGGDKIIIDSNNSGSENVTLDGSASTDEGTITSWDWTEGVTPLGSGETLNHVFAVGTHTVTLTVTDNDGATNTDDVIITVDPPNQAPIADAGPNQDVVQFDSVTLDGSGSYDPDGDTITHEWVQISGQAITLNDADSDTATFTALEVKGKKAKTLVFELTVTDEHGASSAANSVAITVSKAPATNNPPTADAGGPYSGTVGIEITFDGSGSSDDGTITDYDWDFGDGNVGSGVSSSHTYSTTGTFDVTLTVTDDNGEQDSQTTTITVSELSSITIDSVSPYEVPKGTTGNEITITGSGFDNTAVVSFENGRGIVPEIIGVPIFVDSTLIITVDVGSKGKADSWDLRVTQVDTAVLIDAITITK